MTTEPTKLLTLDEVAAALRLGSSHSLWRHLNRPGGIPTINISGKHRLVDEKDLQAFIARRRAG